MWQTSETLIQFVRLVNFFHVRPETFGLDSGLSHSDTCTPQRLPCTHVKLRLSPHRSHLRTESYVFFRFCGMVFPLDLTMFIKFILDSVGHPCVCDRPGVFGCDLFLHRLVVDLVVKRLCIRLEGRPLIGSFRVCCRSSERECVRILCIRREVRVFLRMQHSEGR